MKNGANLEHGDHIRVTVSYNPQPQPLTRGQIARVYGTCLGRKVALLSYKSSGTQESTWRPCLSPYDVVPDAPVPTSTYAAHELWKEARTRYESLDASVPITVARVRMSRWELDGDRFAVSADLGDVLESHGPGVYQVVLFGVLDGGVETNFRALHLPRHSETCGLRSPIDLHGVEGRFRQRTSPRCGSLAIQASYDCSRLHPLGVNADLRIGQAGPRLGSDLTCPAAQIAAHEDDCPAVRSQTEVLTNRT